MQRNTQQSGYLSVCSANVHHHCSQEVYVVMSHITDRGRMILETLTRKQAELGTAMDI